MKVSRSGGWALVLGALLLVSGPVGAQVDEASSDPLALPPGLDAESSQALARADSWLDEWSGDSSLLEAARVEIERVLEAHPDSAEAHRRYAEYQISGAMHNSSNYDADGLARAEKSLARALELDPNDKAAVLIRARVYRLQKRLAEARTELELLETQGLDSEGLHWQWSYLLMEEGKTEDALARCKRIGKSGKASRHAADDCSIWPLRRLGRLDEVDRLFREKTEREPTYAWGHGNRAQFLLCTRHDSLKAIESASRAISLMDYPHARLTLAAALYYRWAELSNTGKFDEADTAWTQAAATMDGDPAGLVAAACHVGLAKPVLKALRDTRRGTLLSPVQTVMLAAETAPEWLPGVFGLAVQGSGRGRGREEGYVFLNSEADYRDPRSVTVRFTPEAATAYRARHGTDPDTALAGKTILVYGFARQLRIDFVRYGMPSGKYYYQTHIIVTDPDQVTIYDPDAPPPRPLPPRGVKA
jgi:tetratricopeptide (TPR) repeat protein